MPLFRISQSPLALIPTVPLPYCVVLCTGYCTCKDTQLHTQCRRLSLHSRGRQTTRLLVALQTKSVSRRTSSAVAGSTLGLEVPGSGNEFFCQVSGHVNPVPTPRSTSNILSTVVCRVLEPQTYLYLDLYAIHMRVLSLWKPQYATDALHTSHKRAVCCISFTCRYGFLTKKSP